jgi:hypothetical protein
MHPYTHTCMHACMHTYIHTYIHTHTHARTQERTHGAAPKAGTIFSCKQPLTLGQQAMPTAKYFHFNKCLCSAGQSSESGGF